MVAVETQKAGKRNMNMTKIDLWLQSSEVMRRAADEVKAEVVEAVPRGVAIIRHHRLLGVKAGAEVKLDTTIEGARWGGRADLY